MSHKTIRANGCFRKKDSATCLFNFCQWYAQVVATIQKIRRPFIRWFCARAPPQGRRQRRFHIGGQHPAFKFRMRHHSYFTIQQGAVKASPFEIFAGISNQLIAFFILR